MSYGDEIMASGQALSLHHETGKRVRIVDREGKHRWNPLWKNLPWIVKPGEFERRSIDLINGVGSRPYLDYSKCDGVKAAHTNWRARDHIGKIILDESELEFAERVTKPFGEFLLIEPNIAVASNTVRWSSNPNKQWGRENWQELIRLAKMPVVQIGEAGIEVLDGAYFIRTENFRLGAAVLARATELVLPESGLHHAAAALNKHAVVLFGGLIGVETTGYPFHTNISRGDPCRMLVPCAHCEAIWKTITPQEVAGYISSAIR